MSTLRLLAFSILAALLPVLAHAQSPFATDIIPTLTFDETLSNSFHPFNGDITDYEEELTDVVTMSGTMSLQGVDISSFNASTPYDVELGYGLALSGTLGDDSTYAPGKTTATIPIIGSDWQTNADIQVGTMTLSWTPGALVVRVSYTAEDDSLSPLAWFYEDDDEGTDPFEDDSATVTVQFADRILDYNNDYNVFAAGTATIDTNPDSHTDNDLWHTHFSGAIDSTLPTITITSPLSKQLVLKQPVTIQGTADDPSTSGVPYVNSSGIWGIQVKLNNGDWQDASFDDLYSSWYLGNVQLQFGTNTVSVQATDGVGLQSTIVTRTFTYDPATGQYTGNFSKRAGTYRCVGSLTVALLSSPTASRSASGSVKINGKTYRFTGVFNSAGVFSKSIVSGGKVVAKLTLYLNTASFNGTLTGVLSYNGKAVPLTVKQ